VHYLIIYRIYQVLALIYERLEPFLVDPAWPGSVEEMAFSGELIIQYQLRGQQTLRIREKYRVERYKM